MKAKQKGRLDKFALLMIARNNKKGSLMEIRREQLRVDPQKCTGCHRCVMACSMKHHGTIHPQLSRIRIFRFEDPDINVPVICMACDEAPCIKVCPMNARIRQANGTVVTDSEKCIGCRACIYICPVGSPAVNPYTDQTMTCDMCQDDPSGPWCAAACKQEGAIRVCAGGNTPAMAIARERAGLSISLFPDH